MERLCWGPDSVVLVRAHRQNNATWHSLGRWGRFCYSVCMPRIYNKASKQELITPTQYLEDITFLRLSAFDLIISEFVISRGPNPFPNPQCWAPAAKDPGALHITSSQSLLFYTLQSALTSMFSVMLDVSWTIHHNNGGNYKIRSLLHTTAEPISSNVI